MWWCQNLCMFIFICPPPNVIVDSLFLTCWILCPISFLNYNVVSMCCLCRPLLGSHSPLVSSSRQKLSFTLKHYNSILVLLICSLKNELRIPFLKKCQTYHDDDDFVWAGNVWRWEHQMGRTTWAKWSQEQIVVFGAWFALYMEVAQILGHANPQTTSTWRRFSFCFLTSVCLPTWWRCSGL